MPRNLASILRQKTLPFRKRGKGVGSLGVGAGETSPPPRWQSARLQRQPPTPAQSSFQLGDYKEDLSTEVEGQAHSSSQTSFLLGASCLELGSFQRPQMDQQGSMKSGPAPGTGLHAEGLVLQVVAWMRATHTHSQLPTKSFRGLQCP